jgi:hypothetical protein
MAIVRAISSLLGAVDCALTMAMALQPMSAATRGLPFITWILSSFQASSKLTVAAGLPVSR